MYFDGRSSDRARPSRVKGDSRDGPSRKLTIADPLSMPGATRRFAGLGDDDGTDYDTRFILVWKVDAEMVVMMYRKLKCTLRLLRMYLDNRQR
jgi:hypothetical protein